MRIAFVASECAPLIKIGGLADVVGSLPRALSVLGHDVRVFLPNYSLIDAAKYSSRPTNFAAQVRFAGKNHLVRLRETVLPGSSVVLYLVDWPEEFQGEVYPLGQDHDTAQNNICRFIKYDLAVARLIPAMSWQPELVHCHDWHTALIPALLKKSGNYKTVQTIHNIDIQGKWSASEVFSWLEIEPDNAAFSYRDRNGDLNFLQTGIRAANQVTTVSPTYAQEILSPEYGEGLEDDLRAAGVTGILNGIDTDSYDPEKDLALAAKYSRNDFSSGKEACKASLQNELGLPINPRAPLFVNVGRLVPQKGVDLLLPLLEKITALGGQVALLGAGFPDIEDVLRQADERLPGVAARFEFNASLGRRLYAGGDFFLMPSRFEPCGLGQLIAMRYGTIPIVRDIGGLHDTVINISENPQNGSGISFTNPDAASLWQAINEAMNLYSDRRKMAATIQRIMSRDSSWYNSARAYEQLYQKIQNKAADPASGNPHRLRT